MDETGRRSGSYGCGPDCSGRRVEHYEMAGYGTVHNFSELLGEEEAAELLAETLEEEEEADAKLTALAQSINVEAKA